MVRYKGHYYAGGSLFIQPILPSKPVQSQQPMQSLHSIHLKQSSHLVQLIQPTQSRQFSQLIHLTQPSQLVHSLQSAQSLQLVHSLFVILYNTVQYSIIPLCRRLVVYLCNLTSTFLTTLVFHEYHTVEGCSYYVQKKMWYWWEDEHRYHCIMYYAVR